MSFLDEVAACWQAYGGVTATAVRAAMPTTTVIGRHAQMVLQAAARGRTCATTPAQVLHSTPAGIATVTFWCLSVDRLHRACGCSYAACWSASRMAP
jgi:hypothetical protein